MSQWLRLYTDLINDPKVQLLPAEDFKGWINILCIAKEGDGALPAVPHIAFRLRLTEEEATALIQRLYGHGLLDKEGKTFTPHNWNNRQYVSDSSTARVKEFREKRRRNGHETLHVTTYPEPRNVAPLPTETEPRNVDVTPPDTDTDTDTETETEQKQREKSGSRSQNSRSRQPTKPKECDSDFLNSLQQDPAYEGIDVQRCFHKARVWCANNRRQLTQRFFINWLNHEDRPISVPPAHSKNGPMLIDPNTLSPKTRGNAYVVEDFVRGGDSDDPKR
jgi:hypothetical protein